MAGNWFGRGKVVTLMAAREAAVPAQFAQIEAYWRALRPEGAGLPRRADFNPRGIADLLEQTLLLERIAPGQVRIRLAGMALCDLLGMELRGMPLSALLLPEARAAFSTEVEQVFDRPAIASFRLEGETGIMRPPFSGQLMMLPMLGQGDQPGIALACLVTAGRAGRAPRRFALAGSQLRGLTDAVAPPARPAHEPAPGMAEAPAPFAAAPPPRGRPQLRLVKG